ncbi:MAG: hypothetical protein ACXU9C_19285 [Xanthobacteraceae bacterium]
MRHGFRRLPMPDHRQESAGLVRRLGSGRQSVIRLAALGGLRPSASCKSAGDQANTNMEKRVRIDPAGATTVDESWELQSQGGDSIQLQVQYLRGPTTTGKAEQLMYSTAKPGFYRIYRSEQARDVVRGLDTDRVKKIDFKASGPKLGEGAQLIGVISEPWYTRQTYLPES